MKKFILFAFALVSLSLFVACGGSENDDATNQATNQTQQGTGTTPGGGQPAPGVGPDAINWDEHVTFTWWTVSTPANDYYTSYNENPVNRHLEHRFNVTFNFEQPVLGTEGDSLALMMGTGRYTDVINLSVYPGSIEQLYNDGIIIDIAQWLHYMPNLQHIIDNYPHFARGIFDDNGRILTLPQFTDEPAGAWTGFMYRHDILETMTGGNVQFPSGNELPTTIADWEYMLPIMVDYFVQSGFADFAPLIIPAAPTGLFPWGDLASGFGAFHLFYVRDDVVHAGMMQPGMFEYTQTMRRWFENGWIHQDFLSRTQDMFFMPNPPLVHGGMAGVFFGLQGVHGGDRMSIPEMGMNFDVRAISSPLADGITHRDMLTRSDGYFDPVPGNAVYVGNPDIGRFLAIMDIFYTEEGSLLRQVGIRSDQVAPNDTVLARMGIPDGNYWFEADGRVNFHPYMDEAGGHIMTTAVSGIRFPGIAGGSFANNAVTVQEEMVIAQRLWRIQDFYGSEVFRLPPVLSPTADESAILSANAARFTDLIDQRMAAFITGGTPLNEETWNGFLDELRNLGYEENRDIWQTVYDRYLMRGQ